jgi:hypothetical protein
MPDAKSGRVHILRQLAVPGGVAAEDAGNHLLLSLTRRSERCRSGSEISGAGLCQRQGAERRSRGVEGCRIRDELIAEADEAPVCKTIIRGFKSHPRLQFLNVRPGHVTERTGGSLVYCPTLRFPAPHQTRSLLKRSCRHVVTNALDRTSNSDRMMKPIEIKY